MPLGALLQGYLTQQNEAQQQGLGQLQQAGGLINLQNTLQQQQDTQKIKGILSDPSLDTPDKKISALNSSGTLLGIDLAAKIKAMTTKGFHTVAPGAALVGDTGQAVYTNTNANPDRQPEILKLQDALTKLPQDSPARPAIEARIASLGKPPVEPAPTVRVVPNKASSTGYSYSDMRNPGKFLAEAPAPTSANQQAAANALSPEAIKQAAARYRVDGTLVNMGWGTAGALVKQKVLNEAAAQAAAEGKTGEEERIRQVALGSLKQALGQLEKNRANITAFEKTANANADLALQQSELTDRTGSPVVNRWVLAGRKSIAGDPQVAKFDLAVRTFINEYARVTTTVTGGGVTSDTARKEIEATLNSAQTKEQVKQVISLAKQEMNNRIKAYDDQVGELRGRMSIPNSGPTPTPAPTAPKRIKFDAQGNIIGG